MDPNNTTPETQVPASIDTSQSVSPAPKSSVGPLAGAIIIILLLVAGGLYFWGAKLNENLESEVPYIPSNDMTQEDSSTTLTSDTSAGLPPQSSSDDVSSIEADANAMNTDQLNSQNSAELNNI